MSRWTLSSGRPGRLCAALVAVTAIAVASSAADAAIRVVTYNVDSDVDRDNNGYTVADGTYATASVASVLEAIGGYSLAGNTQAPDVISVQEPYATPSVTLSSIVTYLNGYYGAGTYAYDPIVGATTGSTSVGNGPNGLIYKTGTIKVNAVAQVGTPSGSGESRAPMRYTLTAIGTAAAASNNTFYLYGEHTKASTGTDNALRRAYEMDAVRADADALGGSAHVLFTGDFNLAGSTDGTTTSGSNEQGYRDLTAVSGTTLATNGNPASGAAKIVAGVARAYDPQTSTFVNDSNAYAKYYTESDDSLTARFDLQLLTSNTLASSTALGLRLVDKTYLAFGNAYYSNGVLTSVHGSGGSIATGNVPANSGYSTATLDALLAASDHLPVVADYVIAVPEPTSLAAVAVGLVAVAGRRRRARATR